MKKGQFSHKEKKKKKTKQKNKNNNNWKHTFWIVEKIISVELSAPKQ